ncbi:MAG TPA: hypothetical protein VND65_01020 [Candidatus Binatia bacterium]|nr:hypothetical protein [Candidatus Binatia bacterium]
MTLLRRSAPVCLFSAVIFLSTLVSAQVPVTTYHYDNNRTGWDQNETILTPSNVNTSNFGLLNTVALDDQVDAQPLYVPGVNITAGGHKGSHNVVYVVTENDTVYAIDADAGTVLLSVHLGAPVVFPLGCNNNGPNVGITSTPVIDTTSDTLYLIAYVQEGAGPAYYLHALDLGSLADKITPQLVTASHTLSDGSTFNFNATYQRQRPALLEANGNIYAGFGSFCDFNANLSRGWLLGWNASTLAPVSSNQVFDTLASNQDDFFLSSIWMSGYGPAADDEGNIVFVTGNSDYSGNSYNGVTSIQESTIKVSSDLSTVVDLFTPSNQSSLDQGDTDFGSGGALVLPDQPGHVPHLIVAAGKDGNMYLMDGDRLGGYSPSRNNVLGTYQIGSCWCGQSYYLDPTDGAPRVVSSGGNQVLVWKLKTSPRPSLTQVSQSPAIRGGQNPGFFTTISSNGTANPIIWALSHPNSQQQNAVALYAFNPDGAHGMTTLIELAAGNWPNFGGNSNLVPLVANGKVYVGSNKQLRIFGLKPELADLEMEMKTLESFYSRYWHY